MSLGKRWLVACVAMGTACGNSASNAPPATPVANASSETEAALDDGGGANVSTSPAHVMEFEAPSKNGSEGSAARAEALPQNSSDAGENAPETADPVHRGSLTRTEIKTVIRRHLPRIRYCYESELIKQPTLAGKVETSFTIGADGSVVEAAAQGFADHNVESCVVTSLRAMQFPKPRGGGIVMVSYPFIFKASE